MTTTAKKKKQKPQQAPQAEETVVEQSQEQPAPVRVAPQLAEASLDSVINLHIKEIVSNTENPRDSAPGLYDLGYGIFTKVEGSDKPALVAMALSEDPEQRAEFVKLILKFEPKLAELADDILVNKLMHPIIVRPSPEGYDLVVGCRRLLAVLYNSCKENAPAVIRSQVWNVENAMYMAFSENAHRLDMSPIEEARWFSQMRNLGLKVNEIAEKTKKNHQVVRQRLELLQLPQELQNQVHEGEIGVVKALEIHKGKRDPAAPSSKGKGPRGDGSRNKAPSLKEWEEIYNTDDTVHEKVREFIALRILHCEYVTFRALQVEIKKAQEKVAAAGK